MPRHDDLRQVMRRRRRQIPQGAQLRAAHLLAKNIRKTMHYRHSQHIAFYWAVAGEISLQPLLKQAWKDAKTCYLPVIDGDKLLFAHFNPMTLMKLNQYGIPEPMVDKTIALEVLDLVLTPLVAFDFCKHRIGMGGGFYDKTFARYTGFMSDFSMHMMGVAHRCQQVARITPASWDVSLDSVVTDMNIVK